MSIRLIITDVDGCVSSEASVPFEIESFATLCRISREASAGRGSIAPMTLCTGRPQPYVELLTKLMDIRFPAICESGAVLYDLAGNHARYAPGISHERLAGLRRVRSFIETEVLTKYKTLMQFGKESQLSVFSETPEIFGEIKPMIEQFDREQNGPGLLVNASHCYLNVSLAGADKGSAIRHLLQELGLKREEVAGIGDTEGDLPLEREVGFFACPSNSTAEVKEVADYVSPHATIEGLLDILKRPEMKRV